MLPSGLLLAAAGMKHALDHAPPLSRRVVTGYHSIAHRFFKEKGFKHYSLLSADGALEAAPAMGAADIILDLVWGVKCGSTVLCLPVPAVMQLVKGDTSPLQLISLNAPVTR